MDPITILAIALATGGLAIFTGFSIYKSQKKRIISSQAQITDAEILLLAHQRRKFTTEELSETTGLDMKDAELRIGYLFNLGAFQEVISPSNTLISQSFLIDANLETLQERALPENPPGHITPDHIEQLAEVTGNHFSAIELAVMLNIPLKQAMDTLRNWDKGQFIGKTGAKDTLRPYYAVPNKSIESGESSPKAALVQNTGEELSDAAIIQAAVERGGKITASALCMTKDIPIDAARKRLQDLQEKEVFEVYANLEGAVEFQLIDKSLLE